MKLWAFVMFLAVSLNCGHCQWVMQNSDTRADLRGIYSLGNGIAWASGTEGTVLRTTNNGEAWQRCAVPPEAGKLDFRGIQAFDENTAIVMSTGPGDQSRLYKTTDGCLTWKLIFTNPDKDGFWDALFFENRQSGWLLGEPTNGSFALFESSNAGWVKQRNSGLQAQHDSQGAFAASNSSLFAKYGFVLFGSGGKSGAFVYALKTAQICVDNCPPSESNIDGGKNTWVRQAVPIGETTEWSGIFSIGARPGVVNAPLGSFKLIVVGGDYKQPDANDATCAYSVDGGEHWLPAKTPPHGYRSAVAYEEKIKAWITVGPNGTDISTDDGRNWRALTAAPREDKDADKNWNALSLPFVVGPHGRIGKLRPLRP